MKRIVGMIILVIAFIGMLTGCGEESVSNGNTNGLTGQTDDGLAISFVCGIHNSFPYYGALMHPHVQDAAYRVSYVYGDVSAYIVDGDPFIVVNQEIAPPEENVDEEKRKMLAEDSEMAILNGLSAEDVIAKCDEVDTIQAISLSANSLRSSDASEKEMYILDSGLSTTGVLDFASQNIINTDPDYIVNHLKEEHAIPDLNGITIRWIGFGQTCGKQKTLSSDYLYKLKAIWEAILKEGGAIIDEKSFNMEALENIEMEYELPDVTSVPVVISPVSPQETDTGVEGTVVEPENTMDDTTIIEFGEDTSVKFQPNTAELIDEELAVKDLESVVNYLKKSPDCKIYIAGMTATYGDSESCKNLSLERANAVKNIILHADAGISESQMTVLGLGYEDNSLRVPDIVGGELVEEQAKKNRVVYVLGENADGVEELLSVVAK